MWYRVAQIPVWAEHSETWLCFILFDHWWYYLDVAWLFPHHLTPALDFNFHCEVWKRWSSLTMHLWVELWEVITVIFNRVESPWIINFVRKREIRVQEYARTHRLPISCHCGLAPPRNSTSKEAVIKRKAPTLRLPELLSKTNLFSSDSGFPL